MGKSKKKADPTPLIAATKTCKNCGQPLINPRGGLWLHSNPEHPGNPRLGWTFCGTNPAFNDHHATKLRATPLDA